MESSNKNIDQYNTIHSITPEELENPEKSNTIKYLQYLSIIFSILFSIAGIIYFITGGKYIFSETNNNTNEIKNVYLKRDIPNNRGTISGEFIWSNEVKNRINFKEANDFCYSLHPIGAWRIPSTEEVTGTYIDKYHQKMNNTILTEDKWYFMTDKGESIFCYNPITNHITNCNTHDNTSSIDGKENIIKCITEITKIYPIYTEKFPGCKDENIILSNGQVWAACNLGSSIRWNGITTLMGCKNMERKCEWTGSYYQFGSIDDSFIPNSRNSTSIKSSNSIKNSCPTGWHIPTFEEWTSAYLVTGSNVPNLRSILYLGETGFKKGDTGDIIIEKDITRKYLEMGNYQTKTPIIYWSSTVTDGKIEPQGGIKMLDFTYPEATTGVPKYIYQLGSDGFSIRCIKN